MNPHTPAEPEAWSPDPRRFITDLKAKPEALARLAASPDVRSAIARVEQQHRVVFLGMGSSRYAAEVAALRLRRVGIDAVAEYASARATAPAEPGLLAVGISASGTSRETVAALERYGGASPTLAITNEPASPLASLADIVVPLEAGDEAGGVACRTFQHTGLVLRLLEAQLTATRLDFPTLCERVAAATRDLLDRRSDWLPVVAGLLDGPDGMQVLAPAERWSSAAQSALMMREGPRRPATASETGDWNHVDVYLTKTTDYRALLLAGSPFDEEAMAWCRKRGSTVVAVGRAPDGAMATIRYPGDDDEEVALHTETLVAELVAATWWLTASRGGREWMRDDLHAERIGRHGRRG